MKDRKLKRVGMTLDGVLMFVGGGWPDTPFITNWSRAQQL